MSQHFEEGDVVAAISPADRKLRELMLYVSSRCDGDHLFGATKLNKILFFADFLAFGRLGKSITGQEYQRLRNGPAPRRLKPLRAAMVEARDCAMAERRVFDKFQHRLLPLRDADLSEFSGEEIAVVDEVISALRNDTASEVSERSHQFIGWEAAAEGEVIPYETVFLETVPLTEELDNHALELARGRGAR